MSGLPDTLPARLFGLAETQPDAVALREKDRGIWKEISWARYHAATRAAGCALHELGVRPGDHVAILSDNRPEWLYADLGAQGIGARAVGIYQTNPSADVAYILRHSGAKVLFCEDQEQVDKAIECRAETPSVETIVVFDPRGLRHYDDDRLLPWADFLARGEARHAAEPKFFSGRLAALDPVAPSMVVYTSGTTGDPKGALISSANVTDTVDRLVDTLGCGPRDTLLSYLPLCHVAEKIFSLFIPLSCGAVVHFGESVETVREDLREVSPTIFLGVPRIWEKMFAQVRIKMQDSSWLKRSLYAFFTARGEAAARRRLGGEPAPTDGVWRMLGDVFIYRALQERLGLRRCRLPFTGAAPISADMLRWFHGVGVPVIEAFGQTECGGVSHFNPPGAVRIGTVGQAVPGTECRIADDGEVLLRGSHVFVGYLHNEQATAETIDADGWLHTGDIGAIDGDGYLSITGRKKEIIITAGGKNLSPEKIENALKTSPYVKEAVALGDAERFIAALVQIDYDAVGAWADRKEIAYTSFEDLAGKPEVHKLIASEIDTANELLARVEQVRAFRLLPKELHQDDGELTATQKVRRRAVSEIHAALIESVYR